VGSYHTLNKWATLELAAYYKRSHFQSDAGQFGSTPMLNFFAFQWGYQMGIDGALKVQITDDLTARGNVAWGRCKGSGLQSGITCWIRKRLRISILREACSATTRKR
jgi:hypothetical protein